MATSLISSVTTLPTSPTMTIDDSRNREEMCSGFEFPKTSFVCGGTGKLLSAPSPSQLSSRRRQTVRRYLSPSAAISFDHIPKSFREENLKDGCRQGIFQKRGKGIKHSLCNKGEMASIDGDDDRLARISSAIRIILDFPIPGIVFQDITTLLLDPKAFKDTIDLFVERYRGKDISVVAGIEARGFIFGPPIALAIGAKFVPLRKPKKLPGEVISEEYSLEYGTDIMEMHVGAVQAGERALVIDDLIATGGTLCAAIRLLERVGAEVVECACVIEIPELKGRDRLGDKPLFILVSTV